MVHEVCVVVWCGGVVVVQEKGQGSQRPEAEKRKGVRQFTCRTTTVTVMR